MENKVPNIMDCEVTACAYNEMKKCHAKAITVGGSHPKCDTFFKTDQKGGLSGDVAMVGACKVTSCAYNMLLECGADGIQIAMHGSHPDCKTYKTL